MKIKTDYGNELEVHKLDQDKEIQFNIEGQGNYVTYYLNINQAKVLIKFLQEQINNFADDIRKDNS
jgi:hypothetical protein